MSCPGGDGRRRRPGLRRADRPGRIGTVPPIPGPDRTCLVVCSAPAPPTCISTLIITILIRIWREVTRVGPASRGGFRPAARGAPGGRLRQVGPQGSGDLSRGGELLRRERVHEQLADGFQVGVRGGPERLGA